MSLKSNEQDHLMMIVVVHPQTSSKVVQKLFYFFPSHEFSSN
jgi:hypothetical protein